MKELNKLYCKCISSILKDAGIEGCMTQEEFEKLRGKIWNYTGYLYEIENEILELEKEFKKL